MKQKKVLWRKKISSINSGSAICLKVSIVKHGFDDGKKVRDLKYAILGKITVQIKEKSNILGGMLSNFKLICLYFLETIHI